MIWLSLNARDRQALARIEETLAGTDPQFAARMSALSGLAGGGAMPERERILEPRWPLLRPLLRGPRPGQPGARRRSYWLAVAMTVAVTLAMISTALIGGNRGRGAACAQWEGIACARQAATSAPSGHQATISSLVP